MKKKKKNSLPQVSRNSKKKEAFYKTHKAPSLRSTALVSRGLLSLKSNEQET